MTVIFNLYCVTVTIKVIHVLEEYSVTLFIDIGFNRTIMKTDKPL